MDTHSTSQVGGRSFGQIIRKDKVGVLGYAKMDGRTGEGESVVSLGVCH